MLRKFFIAAAIASICLVQLPVSVPAQSNDPKRLEKAREVKEKIQKLGTGTNAVVKVKLYSDAEHKGFVSRVGNDDFEVTDTTRKSHTILYSDVRSIGGRNMSTGKKIAIGIGIGAAATLLVLYLVFKEITENN